MTIKMRVLFVTNFYPPKQRGGYEEWCQEIAQQFLDNGHDVRVLTSKYLGSDQVNDPDYVSRTLNLEMDIASLSNAIRFFTHRQKRIDESKAAVDETISHFRPDSVLIWGMWNIPRDIPAYIEMLLPGRVAYYLGDYWPSLPPQFKNYWEAKPSNWIKGIPKAILSAPAKAILSRETPAKLDLSVGIFCSNYLKDKLEQQEICFKSNHIVYGAIDTRPYQTIAKTRQPSSNKVIHLLSLGRIIPDKGVKTIILAINELVQVGITDVGLNIVGSGDPVYELDLKNLVKEMQLEGFVVFNGSVDKTKVPELYAESDIFVFASVWPEPFGRVIIEAMASGVAVVGTSVGGAAELLDNNVNALTFTPGSEVELAQKLETLIKDKAKKASLIKKGLSDAAQNYDITRMFQEIELILSRLTQRA
ncbi:MAG: glycosyltransferase family 4 protein [Chloroflexota bacterium]